MPSNAESCKMYLITGGDTSGVIKNVGTWVCF